MPISDHLTAFAGLPVRDWDPDKKLGDLANTALRVGLGYDEGQAGTTWTDKFGRFLQALQAAKSPPAGLVVGSWLVNFDEDTQPVVQAIVSARDRLPFLRALFVGDLVLEESEISWIHQSDLSPLLSAFPDLEHFGARGGETLGLGTLRHKKLKTLVIQTGGLPVGVLRQVAQAQLPELEHLELWLGDDNYGWDGGIADLQPLLSERRFPKLCYLGLRDSCIADEIAKALAHSEVLKHIQVLDLSLGTLGDEGAEALFHSKAIRSLKKLDIHHHYVSKEMVKSLRSLGIEVDAKDEQEEEEEGERYVEVGE